MQAGTVTVQVVQAGLYSTTDKHFVVGQGAGQLLVSHWLAIAFPATIKAANKNNFFIKFLLFL